MSERIDALLARSRAELEAVRTLQDAGFHLQANSRAYYATFYAAEAALLAVGESRSRHAGVISAFNRLVVTDGGLDPEAGSALSRLFQRRTVADYSWLDSPPSTEDPLSIAQPFIDAVAAWIAARPT